MGSRLLADVGSHLGAALAVVPLLVRIVLGRIFTDVVAVSLET